MAVSPLNRIRNLVRDLRTRGPSQPIGQVPFTPPRQQPAPAVNLPRPSAASPWGSPTYLDYYSGRITTNTKSRDQNNIPLYFDAQSNFLTTSQTPVRAYFGMHAHFDPQTTAAMHQYNEYEKEVVRNISAERIAQVQSQGLAKDAPRYEAPAYRKPPPQTGEPGAGTLSALERELNSIYVSGAYDTPAGKAKVTQILDLYRQYAPPELDTVYVQRDGQPYPIPLPDTSDDRIIATNAHIRFINWLNTARQRLSIFGDYTPVEPQPGVRSWMSAAINFVLDSVPSESYQQFRQEQLGGNALEDLAAVTIAPIRELWQQAINNAPAVELIGTLVPYSSNIGGAGEIKGSTSLLWNHALNLTRVMPGGVKFDANLHGQLPLDLAKIALTLSPPVVVTRTVMDVFATAQTLINGDSRPSLSSASIFGIPMSRFFLPSVRNETQERREYALLENVAEAVERVGREGMFPNASLSATDWENVQETLALNKSYAASMEGEAQLMADLTLSLKLSESFNDIELTENLQNRLRAAVERYLDYGKKRTDYSPNDWRYSWIWAPDGDERRSAAQEAIIQAMMEKGRPLKPWETARVVEPFTEAGSEFMGEAIFDLTNLIPGFVFDNMLKLGGGVLKLPLKVPDALWKHVHMKSWMEMKNFFATRALASRGVFLGRKINEAMVIIRKAVGEDLPAFENAIGDIFKRVSGEEIDLSRYGLLDRSLRRFTEAIPEIDGLTKDKLWGTIVRHLETKGLELTPRNIVDEAAEVVQKMFMSKNRLRGYWSSRAMNEGVAAALANAGWAEPGTVLGNFVKLYLDGKNFLWKIWVPLTLTYRPGYTITNYIDNAFRATVAGAHILLNFSSILDDLGTIPEGVKGGFAATFNEQSAKIANRIIRRELRTDVISLWTTGFKNGWEAAQHNIFKPFNAWQHAWGHVNAASEFMFRVRVYHKFKMPDIRLLRTLVARYANDSLTAKGLLTPEVETILKQALLEAGDDPTRLAAYLSGTGGRYSRLITEELHSKWVAAFGPDGAHALVKNVTNHLQALVDKNALTAENVRVLFDDMLTSAADDLQTRLNIARTLGKNPELDEIDPRVLPKDLEAGTTLADDIAEETAATAAEREARAELERLKTARAGLEAQAQTLTDEARLAIDDEIRNLDSEISNQSSKLNKLLGVEGPETVAEVISDEVLELRKTMEELGIDLQAPKYMSPEEKAAWELEYALIKDEAKRLKDTIGYAASVSTEEFNNLVRAGLARIEADITNAEADQKLVAKMHSALVAAEQHIDAIEGKIRGPLRSFLAEVFPGAARASREGYGTNNTWRIYWDLQGKSLLQYKKYTDDIIAMIKSESWDDILALPIPTRENIFTAMGWRMEFNPESGLLISFTAPGQRRITDSADRFRAFFGFQTKEQFENLPLNEATKPHGKIRFPGAPGSADDVIQEVLSREAWTTILNQTVDGTNTTYRELFEVLGGPLESVTVGDFVGRAQNIVEGLTRAGDLDQARVIQDMYYEIVGRYNAVIYGIGGRGAVPAPLQLHYLPPSIRSKILTGRGAVTHATKFRELMEEWVMHLDESINNNSWFLQALDPNARATLKNLGPELGRLMDNGIAAVDNGGIVLGHHFEGAVNLTNDKMLDYEDYTPIDRFIKDNIYPFWMFPSKSLPMWIRTMAEKPWLAAAYTKYLRYSQRTAFENGAITRNGQQLPSLRGYIRIPGTDMWWDPTQVLSIGLAFPEIRSYDAENEDLSPAQQFGAWWVKYSGVFGMHPSPIITTFFRWSGFLDTQAMPSSAMPVISEFKTLIPPFIENVIIEQMRSRGGGPGRLGADVLDPDVGYYDFLIARRILREANDKVAKLNMTPEQAQALAVQVRSAISAKQRAEDPELQKIWDDARLKVDNDQYLSGLVGFFTAFYGKPFTTGDAAFIQVRAENNMLMMSLNNAALASVFELPTDVISRNEHYQNLRYETPEGFLANTYNLISNVEDKSGNRVYGQEWRDVVSQNIHEQQEEEAMFDSIAAAREAFEDSMLSIEIGSKEFYEKLEQYMETLGRIDQMYASAGRPGKFFGYKPEYIVFNDMIDMIFRYWQTGRPRYDPESGEERNDFQKRRDEWLNILNDEEARKAVINGFMFANLYGPAVRGRIDEKTGEEIAPITFIARAQNWPKDFLARAFDAITPEGYEAWVKANDTPYEALLNAWEETIWDGFFKAKEGLKGDESRLAEMQYMDSMPTGQALNDLMIEHVRREYGLDRFDEKELQHILVTAGTEEIEDRLTHGMTEQELVGNDLWDLLARVPPGGTHHGFFLKELERIYREKGLDDRNAQSHLDTWYNVQGPASFKDAETFQIFADSVKEAIARRGYPELTEDQLKERIEARDSNDKFQEAVKALLGQDFFNFQAEYYALTDDQREAFREGFPDQFGRIKAYKELRNVWAKEFPVWAKYYHRETVEALETGATLEEALAAIGKKGGGGGGKGGGRGGRRSMMAPPVMARPGFRGGTSGEQVFGRLGRGGVAPKPIWPRRLLEIIGEPAAAEVEESAAKGKTLSMALKDYLKNLEANHEGVTTEVTAVYNKIKGGGGGGRVLKV